MTTKENMNNCYNSYNHSEEVISNIASILAKAIIRLHEKNQLESEGECSQQENQQSLPLQSDTTHNNHHQSNLVVSHPSERGFTGLVKNTEQDCYKSKTSQVLKIKNEELRVKN
jgi:hypothetical protein